MTAAVLVGQNEPLEIVELPLPSLDVGQVLVKMQASGVCGRQIDEWLGKRGRDAFIPHLLGHEGVGLVETIGPGVTKVAAGDRVVLHWTKGSGIDSRPPRYQRGVGTISAGWVTTFSTYTIASENRVTPIAADIPDGVAALLGCAVTTGLGIAWNDASLRPGQSIAVFGAGGIGINVVMGAALVNAHPIVAIDVTDEKLSRALGFGATTGVRGDGPDLLARLNELAPGGFDVCVDTTGNVAVSNVAYEATSSVGLMVSAGVQAAGVKIELDSYPLNMGRKLVGSHGGNTNPDRDIPRAVSLYRLGKLNLDDQITHTFPLDRINDAMQMVSRGEVGRCIVVMNGNSGL
jgi:S-(hydroxymethyl)glutathione dehydrogenase/alcohol dehydrogenase